MKSDIDKEKMSDKITLQSIVDAFSKACGVPKKTADSLARAFFDTVIDGLSADESVKINGLGVFRIVEVASRESVSVTSGERIVIPGYKKVNFTPEEGLLDSLAESIDEEPVPHVSSEDVSAIAKLAFEIQSSPSVASEQSNGDAVAVNTSLAEGTSDEIAYETPVEAILEYEERNEDATLDDEAYETPVAEAEDLDSENWDDEIEEILDEVEAPSRVEIKEDEFSGIDMLISTPESVEEIRLELESARAVAVQKLQEAKDAHREVLRLEILLDKMEKSMLPESEEVEENAEDVAEDENVTEPQIADNEQEEDAPQIIEDKVPALAAETVANEDEVISVELPEVVITPETKTVVEPEPIAESEIEELSVDAASVEVAKETETAESQVAEETETPANAAEVETLDEAAKKEEALNRLLSDSTTATTTDAKPEQKPAPAKPDPEKLVPRKKTNITAVIWGVIVTLGVVIIAAMFLFMDASDKTDKNGLKQLPVEPKNAPAKTVAPAPKPEPKDTVKAAENVASEADVKDVKQGDVKAENPQQQAPAVDKKPTSNTKSASSQTARPKTYVLQKGESLTTIAQKFYGTKDYSAILKANNFKNPDNIPIGTEIKLP